GASWRQARSTAAPGGVRGPPGRGLPGLDQRDLRRREAVHAARLHSPGLERGRGPALPGEDRSKDIKDSKDLKDIEGCPCCPRGPLCPCLLLIPAAARGVALRGRRQ